MRKSFGSLTMVLFLILSLAACSKGPSIEQQKLSAITSMEYTLKKHNMTPWPVTSVDINEKTLVFKKNPPVNKIIDGVQYKTWPISIAGESIVTLSAGQRYAAAAVYVVYWYVNAEGKGAIEIGEVKIDSHKI